MNENSPLYSLYEFHTNTTKMIQKLFISSLLTLLSISLWAIDANVTYCTFKGIEQGNYIEVYFHIKGKSIAFPKLDDGNHQAVVEVNLKFTQGEEVVHQLEHTVTSPVIRTASPYGIVLVDLVRLNLDNGDYTLEVTMTDQSDDSNTTVLKSSVSMDYNEQDIHISDVQLLGDYTASEEESPYVKHGYLLKPFTFKVYPSFAKRLIFFTEIYNTDAELSGRYLTRYYLRKAGEKDALTGFLGFKKQIPAPVNILMGEFNISDLPEGKYELVIEVRNAQNEPLKSKALTVRRSYPFPDWQLSDYENIDYTGTFVESLDKKMLNISVRSLSHLLVKDEHYTLNKVVKSKDDAKMRQLLCYYWMKRNEIDPEEPYDYYMKLVEFTNDKFTTAMGAGYKTDRGRIYLQYGSPSDVVSQPSEPNAPPYEVWFYNRTLDNQANVKFVFYNPSLANGDFELLHSTARGEFSDPQWKRKLYWNTLGTGAPSTFGQQAGSIFSEW